MGLNFLINNWIFIFQGVKYDRHWKVRSPPEDETDIEFQNNYS